jgi:hypothetical protein
MQFVLVLGFAPASDAGSQANAVQSFLTQQGTHGERFAENVWLMSNVQAGFGARDIADQIAGIGLAPGYHIFVTEATGNTFQA